MSDISSKDRFWKTYQEGISRSREPSVELSALGRRVLELLAQVQAATIFELRTRATGASEAEVSDVVGQLARQGLVSTTRTKEGETVVRIVPGRVEPG